MARKKHLRNSAGNKNAIHRTLLTWYRKHGRKFYWRKKNLPSYEILVSEFMLQQTQASRVEEKLPLFLKKFPTIKKLASAPQSDVLRAWQGMGYNNRAIRLHRCAKKIVRSHNGKVPDDPETLIELPGIGRYTSRAIPLFAFNKPFATLDVNIARVLTRLSKRVRSAHEKVNEKNAWALAEKFLPATGRDAHDWTQGLMDLGARFCTKRYPKCGDCPVKTLCASARDEWPTITTVVQSREPHVGGLPRRIVRGKIIEMLRSRTMKKDSIVRSLHHNDIKISSKEIHDTLSRLERDGLIVVVKNSVALL